MNKKERKLAMLSILSSKLKEKELIAVDTLNLKSNKTKDFNKNLENLKVDNTAVIITNEDNENLILATRNNKSVNVLTVDKMNVLEIATAKYLIVSKDAIKTIEEVLK